MKLLLLLILVTIITACSSVPDSLKKEMERQELIAKHLSQGKRYVGGDFDSKYQTDGDDAVVLKRIGISTYPANSNETLAREVAISDAKFKLMSAAPSEFKSMVQKAIGNTLGYQGQYNQIETSISEVQRLEGIEVSNMDVECKMVIEPTADLTYKNLRECRAIATVPLRLLREAFDFTIENKYGTTQKSKIEEMLNQQLEDIFTPTRKISNHE